MEIYDINGKKVGSIKQRSLFILFNRYQGEIYNAQMDKVGTWDVMDIYDVRGNEIGSFNNVGDVFDSNGTEIGHGGIINSIHDSNGNKVGSHGWSLLNRMIYGGTMLDYAAAAAFLLLLRK